MLVFSLLPNFLVFFMRIEDRFDSFFYLIFLLHLTPLTTSIYLIFSLPKVSRVCNMNRPCISSASASIFFILFLCSFPLIYHWSISVLSSVFSSTSPPSALLLSFTLLLNTVTGQFHRCHHIYDYLPTCDDSRILLSDLCLCRAVQTFISVSWPHISGCPETSRTQRVLKWTQHFLFSPIPSCLLVLGVVLTLLLLGHARIWKPP